MHPIGNSKLSVVRYAPVAPSQKWAQTRRINPTAPDQTHFYSSEVVGIGSNALLAVAGLQPYPNPTWHTTLLLHVQLPGMWALPIHPSSHCVLVLFFFVLGGKRSPSDLCLCWAKQREELGHSVEHERCGLFCIARFRWSRAPFPPYC